LGDMSDVLSVTIRTAKRALPSAASIAVAPAQAGCLHVT